MKNSKTVEHVLRLRSSMILESLFTGSMNVGGAVSTPLLGRLRGQVVNLDVSEADRQLGRTAR